MEENNPAWKLQFNVDHYLKANCGKTISKRLAGEQNLLLPLFMDDLTELKHGMTHAKRVLEVIGGLYASFKKTYTQEWPARSKTPLNG